ncbi:MAG: 23S rRNA (adenine(2503)-C(2))-methyltransferase RlmN [Candidatus Moranbacteria bacterium]|nr:23S rRNA (adenine(2503)-C(2))-methyltransferase RlmN [Candidatus Moranbacteria bacterium]
MKLEKLQLILKDEPGFREKQAFEGVFKKLVSDWNEVTNLPKNLQEKLNEQCSLEVDGKVFESKDGKTFKALITLKDSEKIEAVLMRYEDGRNSLCVSSQVGCALGCKFCATGKMGIKRSLSSDEIVDQFLFFARFLKEKFGENEKITNVIFMGMGEPFLNYDNVMKAIEILNDEKAIGLGARNISVSTSGIIEGIKKFSDEERQVNLAISLHAPNDELRSELMPINKKDKLQDVLNAVDEYISKRKRKVMFEYLLIDGVNDSEENAKELATLMKKPLYMVNLINYNPTGNFNPSSKKNVDRFLNVLKKTGVNATLRHSFGGDIKAACGQLANES